MSRTIFVTGTDTGVGKTYVAAGLIRAAVAAGLRVAPFKPVAAGCRSTPAGWRNADAEQLIAASGRHWDYATVNPYALRAPIAPHLAAADDGVLIDPGRIDNAHGRLAAEADLVIVEGAGGWRVPLNESLDFAGLVAASGWPVVLVVGLRLGCLNHALLAAQAIAAQTELLGWIGNVMPPVQARWRDNLASLRQRIAAPCLGFVALGADPAAVLKPGPWLIRM